MQTVTDADMLERLRSTDAVFILFGAASCQVCHALRPQLEALLAQDFPDLRGVYIDCARTPALCAQHGVFSLPVVQVYIEGSRVAAAARAFGVQELRRQLQRPVALWRAGRAAG